MLYGRLIRDDRNYEAGQVVTYRYVGSQLMWQPLIEKRTKNLYHSFLPTFEWSAQKYIGTTGVDSISIEELSIYIRQRLGRPYLITTGKNSYLYLYNGLKAVDNGRVLHYSTLWLEPGTMQWIKDARAVTSTLPFLDRDLTDEETSLIAIANLQLTDDM